MKDEIWQKRQFLLTSFRRLDITINTQVYRFVDKLIRETWDSSSMSLDEIDYFIRQEFNTFIKGS
jgi:3-oxoacyl-[acyl-carrier-protein] synthase III